MSKAIETWGAYEVFTTGYLAEVVVKRLKSGGFTVCVDGEFAGWFEGEPDWCEVNRIADDAHCDQCCSLPPELMW